MNLKTQIILIGIVCLIPIILGSLIFNQIFTQYQEELTNRNLKSMALLIGPNLILNFNSQLSLVEALTERHEVRDLMIQLHNKDVNQERINHQLNLIKDEIASIKDIYLLNDDKILAATNEKINFNELRHFVLKKNDVGIYFFFEESGSRALYLKKIYENHIEIGEVGLEFYNDPLRSRVSQFGETGEILYAIRDNQGDAVFLGDLRFDPEGKLQRTVSKDRTDIPITLALGGVEGYFNDKVDYVGNPILAVTGYVEEYDIGFVVKQNVEEFSEVINFIYFVETLIILVTVTSILVILFLLSELITKPISNLKERMIKMANGNTPPLYQYQHANDEIKALTQAFNELSVSLNASLQRQGELKKDLTKLEYEKLSVIGELSASVAHDLKNPLSSILNSTKIINLKNVSSSKIIEESQRIQRNALRMSHQINDVLEFIKTSKLIINESSLLEIIRKTIDDIDIPENIEIEYPQNDSKIPIDEEKIRIVLTNIIINAIQAIGQKNGKITFLLKQSPRNVELQISNNGPDIPDEIIEKIFDPLFSTKQIGTGLGLASSRIIINAHGGKIYAENNPVTFYIILPIKW